MTSAPPAAPIASPDEVLDFWFGAPGSPQRGQPREAWFRKDRAFDAAIAARFGASVEAALADGLRAWLAEPNGTLARIVLLDQFTRNIFRGSAQAFAGDALALEAARALVDGGSDLGFDPVQRAFVYLPFEHAEDLALQDESVRRFGALSEAAPALGDMLDYALRHRDVIRRFGRFPHRNAALARVSTPAEIAYLAEPGSGF